jgi:hypothetical protein
VGPTRRRRLAHRYIGVRAYVHKVTSPTPASDRGEVPVGGTRNGTAARENDSCTDCRNVESMPLWQHCSYLGVTANPDRTRAFRAFRDSLPRIQSTTSRSRITETLAETPVGLSPSIRSRRSGQASAARSAVQTQPVGHRALAT